MNKIHVKFKDEVMWPFLRSGWSAVMPELAKLHTDQGVIFDGFLDLFFGQGKEFKEPWIGFLHHTPNHPKHVSQSYGFSHDRSLNSLFKQPNFIKSQRFCKGIFTLSEYTKKVIQDKLPDVVVVNLILPTEIPDLVFSMDRYQQNESKKVVMIGHWLRKYRSMFDLRSPIPKFILFATEKFNFPRLINLECSKQINEDVQKIDRLDNAGYDDLLSKNIIFLDLYDAAANNVVVECIARKTPLLVNRLPATEEYLGVNYPFFFSDLKEAENKINDPSLIEETHEYLGKLPIRGRISVDYFVNSFVSSEIYKGLSVKGIQKIFL